ncbi:hypothetical protein IFM89_011188 [Coptis chinensis]|uniref:CCHC-type domain-containing protein n=1 Tax=Coptis chinensis TaxID=261450 RepID=A0A835HSE9_9MAGN|nr:hypothetical protein IFM89_011188 [Coptis chinensis]
MFSFKQKKNDKERYFVICKYKNCKWFVKCSKKINELTVKLRKYNDIHTCEADEENKVMQAKALWVANELEAFARAHPTFAPVDLFNEIYREYGVHIFYWTAWRARIMLLEKMHGAAVITTLWNHSEQLMQAISIQLPIKNTGTRLNLRMLYYLLQMREDQGGQRIRGNDKEKASGKIKCRNCGEVGHNARTCKKAAKETSSSPSKRGKAEGKRKGHDIVGLDPPHLKDLILPGVYNNFSARQIEICRQFINLNPKCSHKMVLDHMVKLNWEENHGSKKEEGLHGGEHHNIPKKIVVQALKAKGFVLPKLK